MTYMMMLLQWRQFSYCKPIPYVNNFTKYHMWEMTRKFTNKEWSILCELIDGE